MVVPCRGAPALDVDAAGTSGKAVYAMGSGAMARGGKQKGEMIRREMGRARKRAATRSIWRKLLISSSENVTAAGVAAG